MRADDNLTLMTWRARPDMSCEYVNPAWLDYTAYTAEEALGKGWTSALHPEDLAHWLDTCVRAFDERAPFAIEYRLRRRDGEYRWVLDRAVPRLTAEGLFLGYLGVCVDIDDYKREQQRLSRALERNARAQSRVVASLLELAHRARESADDRPLLAGVRVLVIDQGDGVVRPLEVAGADVRVAASAAQALDTLGAWHPDVVLSGINDSFIRAVRTLPAERARDARLAKPVEPVALLATVARLAA
jgi:PAS domain S-box-containing protein